MCNYCNMCNLLKHSHYIALYAASIGAFINGNVYLGAALAVVPSVMAYSAIKSSLNDRVSTTAAKKLAKKLAELPIMPTNDVWNQIRPKPSVVSSAYSFTPLGVKNEMN